METSPTQCDGSKRRRARALFDNLSECADELAFRRGDLLTVLTPNRPPPDGWWLCSLRGRQGLCPANRLRLLPETTRDKTDSKVKLSRAKSMHQSTGPDNSPSAFQQRNQLRRSASSLSGGRTANQDTGTCSPETYDTPPRPRIVLRAAPVLEYDVPRPPASSGGPQRSGRPAAGPFLLLRAAPAAERDVRTAVSAQDGSSVPGHAGLQSAYHGPAETSLTRYGGGNGQNGPLYTADDGPQTNCTARGGDQSTHANETKSAEMFSQRKSSPEFPPPKRDMQMNAALADLLDSVKTDEPQLLSTHNRWQGGRPTASSSRPRSDNEDSCESSSTTSPCSSQRFSDSTDSSWAVAPPVSRTVALPIGRTVAPPVNHTVTPPVSRMVATPVCRRTLLRLERELLCALRRVQERRRYLSQEAAALSLQLEVTRLRSALRDLLQFIGCTATGAGLGRALAPLREASRQLERAAGRQEAVGWRQEAPAGSAESDGWQDIQVAVRTLTAHLPLFNRPQAGRSISWGTEDSRSPDRHEITDSWPLELAAPPSDNNAGGRTKSGIFSDRAVAAFYRSQCETHQSRLGEALARLMQAALDRQSASVLLVLCKFVVLSAHRLVIIGDAVGSSVEDHKVGWRMLTASDQLFIALRRTLRATKAAAVETDKSDAVREMAEATQSLAEAAVALDRNMAQLSAMRDTKKMIRPGNEAL